MRRCLPLLLVLLLAAPLVSAATGDLEQTFSDLKSQIADKERMDQHEATKVELAQMRGWLEEAANAIKEEQEGRSRRLFDRVRLQLKLVDELIALSKIETRVDKLSAELAQVKAQVKSSRETLQDKQAQIRALKMTEK